MCIRDSINRTLKMDHFTLSLAVGAVAGTLDIIPMIFQRLPLRSCLSAFFIYFFAAVIVFYSNLPYLPWWADGMAVTLMLMLPVLFTFSGKERKADVYKRQTTCWASPTFSAGRSMSGPRRSTKR